MQGFQQLLSLWMLSEGNSHKQSYNLKSGEGTILGIETKKHINAPPGPQNLDSEMM